jgi:hypothetical protein
VKIMPESVGIPYLRIAVGLIRRKDEHRILGKMDDVP